MKKIKNVLFSEASIGLQMTTIGTMIVCAVAVAGRLIYLLIK